MARASARLVGAEQTSGTELDADWNKVQVKMALAADVFKDPLWHVQVTGGSSSFRNRWDLIRGAGAVARKMLIDVAANKWNIDPDRCKTVASKVEMNEIILLIGAPQRFPDTLTIDQLSWFG